MINIAVFSRTTVSIESKDYIITSRLEMIDFLKDLLDKVAFSGERFCLESADINEKGSGSPIVEFTEIKRWGFLK